MISDGDEPSYLFAMSAQPNWKIGGGKFSDVVRNDHSEEDAIFDRKYPELRPLFCFQGTVSPLFQQTDIYLPHCSSTCSSSSTDELSAF